MVRTLAVRNQVLGEAAFVFLFTNHFLPILIHRFVILFVVAAGDVVEPFLVVEVPAHSLFDAFLELQRRFPAEFLLELGGVDGVAGVVA